MPFATRVSPPILGTRLGTHGAVVGVANILDLHELLGPRSLPCLGDINPG